MEKLGQISFYLAKSCSDISVLKDSENPPTSSFPIESIEGADVEFLFLEKPSYKKEPSWLSFINRQLKEDDKINYTCPTSTNVSGVLLIRLEGDSYKDDVLIATFGVSGGTLINKGHLAKDFGIKVAMNLCGNQSLRQVRSRKDGAETQHIDRQSSKPLDSQLFGLSNSELLGYISANLPDKEGVTLQGKDSITIKATGEDKFDWNVLIGHAKSFLDAYRDDSYLQMFPNYLNLQEVTDGEVEQLDLALIEKLKAEDFSRLHIAIPEFIPDDEYSFSYTCHDKRENYVYSTLDIQNLIIDNHLKLDNLTVDKLKSKKVFAWSHAESRPLCYKNWRLYDCIVFEYEVDGEIYLLSSGVWNKVDSDFYTSLQEFMKNVVVEKDLPESYKNISIFSEESGKNEEGVFNKKICGLDATSILFDRAKLSIAGGEAKHEFCDIFRFGDGDVLEIVQVKQYKGASSLSHLFVQSRFYGESFLFDQCFLEEIRSHITASDNANKEKFLRNIPEKIQDNYGKLYSIALWLLYDKSSDVPTKTNIPLMVQYEIKSAYELLKNRLSFSEVSISFVPVHRAAKKVAVKKNGAS